MFFNCFLKGTQNIGEISVDVKQIHRHPSYWADKYHALVTYDIAVVTLEKPIRFSTTILPACLPYQSSVAYINSSATAAGWGETFKTGNPHRLNEVDLTILPMKECQKAPWIIQYELKKNVSKDVKLINESHALCAGRYKQKGSIYNYTGVNHGDSGGPLTIKDIKTGLHTIIGVASLGPHYKEYEGGPYFIFSDVMQFLPWISKIMSLQ